MSMWKGVRSKNERFGFYFSVVVGWCVFFHLFFAFSLSILLARIHFVCFFQTNDVSIFFFCIPSFVCRSYFSFSLCKRKEHWVSFWHFHFGQMVWDFCFFLHFFHFSSIFTLCDVLCICYCCHGFCKWVWVLMAQSLLFSISFSIIFF